jgi:hypothetical protein
VSTVAGWYPDPELIGLPNHLRYWNGSKWTEHRYVRAQKSAGAAIALTLFWPGAGHLYLGMREKGMGPFIWNAVWFILAVFTCGFAIPIGIVIWLITLFMLIGSVATDTEAVNNGGPR